MNNVTYDTLGLRHTSTAQQQFQSIKLTPTMCQYSSCLTHMISLRIKLIPIFLSRVCSSNETFSVRLNLLLGKLLSPSTSLSPLVSGPPIPILNRSSKSPKSIIPYSRSSSSSLNIVPRTWEKEISHMLCDGINDRGMGRDEVE